MATLTTGHPTLRGTPVITQTLNKEQQRTVSQLLYVSQYEALISTYKTFHCLPPV